MPDFLSFAKQESAQVFIVTAAALIGAWKAGAPEIVLWMLGALGAIFIITEKARAAIRPRKPDGNP